jgi:hypothetical protein
MQTRAQTKKNAFKQSVLEQSIVAQTAVVEQTAVVAQIAVVETCAICCDALHQDALHQDALHQDALPQKIKTLHSGPYWKHCFHNNCIDGWYLACIEKQKTPCCPLCPLTPFPDDYVPSSPIYNKHHALKMFKTIKMYRVIAPYIGIMVCMNGECLFKLTNLNLCYSRDDWEYNSSDHHELTLWHIKDKILRMNKLIYDKYGKPNETWSETLSYLFYSKFKYPKLKIINTSYTIPPKCVSFGEMDMSTIDDDSTLRDIYVDYHTQLEEMKKNPSTDSKTLEHINNISTEKSQWIAENRNYITGYLNPENPNVTRSIYFPWAWVAIHLDYKY